MVIAELRAIRSRSPAGPGVYVFSDRAGNVIYVGKSRNLRSRLGSYVGSSDRRKEKRIARAAASLAIERTGSEFEALLRELSLIQEHRPRFNRRMRSPERYVYIGVNYDDEFPMPSVTGEPLEDGFYLGPFLQRRRIGEIVEALCDAFSLRTCDPLPEQACWRQQVRRCTAPCVGHVSAGDYGRHFLLVREALVGRGREAIRRLCGERDQHAAAERFEAAALSQRRIRAIEGMNRVLYASALRGSDAVIVERVDDRGDEVLLWSIVGGEIRACERGRRGDIKRMSAIVLAAADRPTATGPLPKLELDRRCIVHAWIKKHDGAGVVRTTGLDRVARGRAIEEAAEQIAPLQRAFV